MGAGMPRATAGRREGERGAVTIDPIANSTRLVARDGSYAGRVDAVWCDGAGRPACITIIDDRRGGWRNVVVGEDDFETSWLH